MTNDNPNPPFAGLISGIALSVVLVGTVAVAVVIGLATSPLAGVLAWVAMVLTVGVCVWRSP